MINWIQKKRNKKGFTLIELVVVIAILGILVAIAVPRLGGFRTEAETKANQATARTILSAASITEADKGIAFTQADLNTHLDQAVILATAAPAAGTATTVWTLVRPATGAMTVYKGPNLITLN